MTVKVRNWNGSWFVVCHFRGKRKSHKCKSEAEAVVMAGILSKRLDVLGKSAFTEFGGRRTSKVPTFGTYSKKFLKQQTHLKESTLQRYESSVRVHLKPHFGRYDLDEITWAMCKEFCIEKQEANSKDGIRLMVAALRVIMEEAVREDLVPKNPATKLGKYYGTKTEGRGQKMPFNRKELKKLLTVIKDKWPEYYEWVFCAARTGITFGEQRALEWSDIQFRNGRGKRSQINVTKSWSYGRKLTTPKAKARVRKIDVSPELEVVLKQLRKRRQEECLAKGNKISEYVFISVKGQPIHAPNFIARVWKPALRETGLEYRNWHNLRHTFASQLLMAGENILYVARQLGHANTTTTRNHYAHWIDEENEGQGRGVDVLDGMGEN